MNYIFKILLSAVAVVVLAKILSGVHVDTFSSAIWVAVIIGLLNAVLKPILVVLTLPVTILTMGLFLFIINASMILIASNWLDGFYIDGFWVALLFSLLLSFFESILYKLLE